MSFNRLSNQKKCGAGEYYKKCLTDPNIIYHGGVITGFTWTENHCNDIHPWSDRPGQDFGTDTGTNGFPVSPEPTTYTTTTQTTTTTEKDCDGGCQCEPWMWRHPDGHCVDPDA